MLNKIKKLPISIAIAVMVVLVLIGVTLGNNNALKSQVKACAKAFEPVQEVLIERAGEADNLLLLANRYDVANVKELESTIGDLRTASDAGQATEANAMLNACASQIAEAVRGKLGKNSSDIDALEAVEDDLQSLQYELQHCADEYNQTAESAVSLYQKLPMRFLLGNKPEVFIP